MGGGSASRRGSLKPPGAYVDAAGTRLHYVRAGAGPALVYIHGAKGSIYDFTLSVGPRLAQHYEALAIDRPGSGFSGRPPFGENRLEAQAAALRAAVTHLGLERPLLVGHSLGAAVALAWALDAPDDVAAVVTLGAYVLPLRGMPAWAVELLQRPALLRGLGAMLRSPLARPLVRHAVAPAFSPGTAPDAYLEVAPQVALQPEALLNDGEDRRVAEAGLAALGPRYPGLRAPLVVVVGGRDRVVPQAVSERLHELVPHSELVRLPGAGHLPQFSHPEAVVAAVDRAAALAGLHA